MPNSRFENSRRRQAGPQPCRTRNVIGWLMVAVLFFGVRLPAQSQTARQRQLFDADWRFQLDTNSSATVSDGVPVTQWRWIADDNAPNDAATMAAPGLDVSAWAGVTLGTDVFQGRVGYAWFRSAITNLASLPRPLSVWFASVDDNATVYLNGHLVGRHAGWSSAFELAMDPAWIANGTNILAVAVQNTGSPGGIYGSVLVKSGPAIQPPGILINQWVYFPDDNATNHVAAMTATNLDTAVWPPAVIGQDVFNGHVGFAWFRTSLDALASSGRPLKLHFLCVDDNARVYLNGILIGQHTGVSQPFDLTAFDYAWATNGPNILTVLVENTSGGGGLAGPVTFECGADPQPPGTPIFQWQWLADDNAPNDAATMAASSLNTSGWPTAAIGQDVFKGRIGAVWYRSTVGGLSSNTLPVALHFLGADDNATVYLNGQLLGQHAGGSEPFTIGSLPGWIPGGSNVLAVAVANTGGAGGLLKPVLLQSMADGSQAPVSPAFDDSAWRIVQLPHDYLIEGAYTNTADKGHGYLPQTKAWYRKTFTLPSSVQGQSVWLDFDGVYHDSDMWLNGHYLGNWYSGYASFRYDISDYMIPGGTNVLAVHIDPTINEGWFYEGAGIYRHVWLNVANRLHIAPWGTFVTSDVTGPDASGISPATLTITTTVTNAADQTQNCTVISQAAGPDGTTAGTATSTIQLAGGQGTNVVQMMAVANAHLWSLETPQLYTLHTTLQQAGAAIDDQETSFGIRTLRYDADNGFFLNGKRVELQGMCNHQDFPGVGIGIPDNLYYWRVKKLKEFGVNAWRCSHNPPAPALLDACDRLGMLVMDENRNLGNSTGGYSAASQDTTFTDSSALDSLILRDRNHPSIIMWSMCNEESISGTQHGADLFYAMRQRVRLFDSSRPVTSADLFDDFHGIPLVEDIMGFNYNSGDYDKFHQTYPQQPIYGSETSSAEADRGVYEINDVNYLSSYSSPEGSWQSVVLRPFMAGSFTWTGFDYKGEPSPASWPCVSSKFGILDTCGVPKDMAYYFKAWWDNAPLVHILPHWNWTAGQNVSVWCYGNTASVELFLNGVSQGKQTMPAYGHLQWNVTYAPGTLLARGYDANGNIVATDQVATTGSPAGIRLTTDRTTLTADGQDVTVVYAAIVDAQGRVVPTATNLVNFSAFGAGRVIGSGNGDPVNHQPDHSSQRYAFNGWCMALLGATNWSGSMILTATSPGLTSAALNFQVSPTNAPPVAPTNLSATTLNGGVQLAWPIVLGADSYNVKRATAPGGPYTTIANYTAISFWDPTVIPGTTYYYVVSAVNPNGESPNSKETSVQAVASQAIAAPGGLVALPDDGQIGLQWNTNSGATSYRVQRATLLGGPYVDVAVTAQTTFTDVGLTNGATYYYVVSALINGFESTNSMPISATPVSMSYLVGTITGTAGSWSNTGNTREKAFDGDVNTFFDAPIGSNAWAGLDLGPNGARVISKIRFYPRATFASRMVGGGFQGANVADFSDAVTLFSITTQPTEGGWTTLLNANPTPFRYVRYLSPSGGWGNVAEVEFYSPGPHISKVSGSIVGTTGTSGNNLTNAFDGNLDSYFEAAAPDGNWAGVDAGSPAVITAVRYCPATGNAARMVGGVFQGANTSDFAEAVNLGPVAGTPPESTLTAQAINGTNAFRYLRYLSPAGSYGDVAELQFFTSSPVSLVSPAVPGGLVATPGNGLVGLAWNASAGAVTYNVKRGTVSGGPYTNIVNRTATVHMDAGLPFGTFFYVVSAVNAAGESANSAEAMVSLDCSPPVPPTGLSVTAENGRMKLVWSPVSGVSSYTVLRATGSNGSFAVLATHVTDTVYVDATVTNKATYNYAIQAVNACGSSEPSASISGSLALLNVAPVLDPVADGQLIAGQTVLVTNHASDADLPAQTLKFELVSAPAGATINETNGVVFWRPSMAQGGMAGSLSVAVTDDGLPALSATQTWVVNVLSPARPQFSSCVLTNGSFLCRVSGDFGPDYSLLGSTNLVDWRVLNTTNQPFMPVDFKDLGSTNYLSRFYQIQMGP